MKEEVRIPEIVKEYVKKFGLKKEVKCFVSYEIDTFRTESYPDLPCHHLLCNSESYKGKTDLHSWIHELCHMSLFEKIDNLFATTLVMFDEDEVEINRDENGDYDRTVIFNVKSNVADDGTMNKLSMLYSLALVAEIWVDEYMHSLYPELFFKRIKSLAESLMYDRPSSDDPYSKSKDAIMRAVILSIINRAVGKSVSEEFLPQYTNVDVKMVEELEKIYIALPPLQHERIVDLQNLETFVQKANGIVKFPITPIIRVCEDFASWKI